MSDKLTDTPSAIDINRDISVPTKQNIEASQGLISEFKHTLQNASPTVQGTLKYDLDNAKKQLAKWIWWVLDGTTIETWFS
jgi:hypothetical protein